MDQGLKERLVGAAVLVAIAVWLVPWVLDGPEGGAEAPVSSLQLPSAEEPMPMRTQTLKLRDEPELSAEPRAATRSSPPAEPAGPAEPVPRADAGSDAGGRATQGAGAEPKPEAAATLIAANSAAEPPKSTPAAAPAPKPQATAAGDWTVQLGSFEDEANARRLAQRAGTVGHKAEVSSSKNGARTLYRVRVGPQATKAAADATASALRAHGIDARVVAAR